MSQLELLYSVIATRIKNYVPDIKWIDLWTRQTDFTETAELIDFPAAFISFPNVAFADMGKKSQECNYTIRIYIAYHNYQSTAMNADNAERNEALKFLQYIQTISNVFHGFSSDPTGTLSRTNIVEHDSGTDVCVYYVEFITNLVDELSYYVQTPTSEITRPNADVVIPKDTPPPPPPIPPQIWFNFPQK